MDHTPLPWHRPKWERCGIYSGTEKIAHVNVNNFQYEANVSLLVAAADLLEACREVDDSWHILHGALKRLGEEHEEVRANAVSALNDLQDAVQAAIRKALGEGE